jgi:hypothetical protein
VKITWRKAWFGLRLLVLILAVASTVVYGGVSLFHWQHVPTWLLVAAIGCTASSLLVTGAGALTKEFRQWQSTTLELDASQPLMALAGAIEASRGVPFGQIGISLWLVVPRWRMVGGPHLRRAARLRAMNQVPKSSLKWRSTMGVIGECWRTRQEQGPINLAAIYRKHKNDDEAQWAKAPAKTTLGLSLAQFREVGGRYGVVSAFPVFDKDGKHRGVLSIDVPEEYAFHVDHSDVRNAVNLAIMTLGGII